MLPASERAPATVATSRPRAASRGVERLIAIIRPDDVASPRVAEEVGLVLERTTTSGQGLPVRVYAAATTDRPAPDPLPVAPLPPER